MTAFDWTAFGIGLLAGLPAGVLYFSGLALSIRLAMRTSHPTFMLIMSALFRIIALLGAGWLVADKGGTMMLAGFALTFVIVRTGFVAFARVYKPRKVPQWN